MSITPRELPDQVTHLTVAEALQALAKGWRLYFGAPAKTHEAVLVLAAHWAHETGWGKSMHGWNFGNAKGSDGDGRCWSYFTCEEDLPPPAAKALAAASPLVKLGGLTREGKLQVWFHPKHPVCRFRAFESNDEGACDYVAMLATRFESAWSFVDAGDPHGFALKLHDLGYYTAPAEQYASSVKSIYWSIINVSFDLDPNGPPPSDEVLARATALRDLALYESGRLPAGAHAGGDDEPDPSASA